MNLDQLVWAIPESWNEETLGNEKRHGTHKAAGQCIVSSLLVQRHCGGIIVRCNVGRTYNIAVHYFNELPGGVMIDTTRAQFKSVSPYSSFKKNPPEDTYIFKDTWARVDILEDRCMKALSWRD
jgi:hypothetical protein